MSVFSYFYNLIYDKNNANIYETECIETDSIIVSSNNIEHLLYDKINIMEKRLNLLEEYISNNDNNKVKKHNPSIETKNIKSNCMLFTTDLLINAKNKLKSSKKEIIYEKHDTEILKSIKAKIAEFEERKKIK